jgi:hypothetical protein
MLKKTLNTVLLLVLISSLLLACTSNKEIQTEAIQAITKQSEMKAYSFEGSAALGLSDGLVSATNPLTLGLINMLKESTIEWKGTAEQSPARLEITLKLTPKNASTPIEIPVLIKDNKLYFYMPAISKPGEFFVMDLSTSSIGSNNGIKPEALQNATSSMSNIMRIFINNAEDKWLKEDKEPAQLLDGTTGKSITMEITSSNEKAVNTSLKDKLGEMIDSLTTGGFITTATAETWKSKDTNQFEIKAPSKLQLIIDNEGNIRSQTFDLKIGITDSNNTTNIHAITIKQNYNNINGTPAFEMNIPENPISFNEVLKFLSPTKANK